MAILLLLNEMWFCSPTIHGEAHLLSLPFALFILLFNPSKEDYVGFFSLPICLWVLNLSEVLFDIKTFQQPFAFSC
jgi:hypothetical protein